MKWIDVAVMGVVLLILALTVGFILHRKKKGSRCIGCPAGGCCTGCCDSSE